MRCGVGRIKVLGKKGTRSNCTLGVLELGQEFIGAYGKCTLSGVKCKNSIQ